MFDFLPEQIEDGEIMANEGHALNYSLPGTGKTLTAIRAHMNSGRKRGVVIAPPIALTMWAQEIGERLSVPVGVIRGKTSPIMGDEQWLVTSYNMASGNAAETLADFLGDGEASLILDEAHALKSRTSKRTKTVFGPATTGRRGLFERATQTWSLTGTPITRYADDLWAQMRATKPNVLRAWNVETYEKFCLKFTFSTVKAYHPRQRPQRVVIGNQNEKLLHEMLYGDAKAIRRREVAGMPPLTQRPIDVTLDKSVKGFRTKLSVEQIAAALGGEQIDEGLAQVWRLMSLAKVPSMFEYIAESAMQGPILVGYIHTDVGLRLADMLEAAGLSVEVVRGGVSTAKRDAIREQFNAGTLDILMGQMTAMGTSWNIQESSAHVIVAEDHPSPSVIEQFYKRVYRRGQKNHVQLDFLKADHPVDEALTRIRTRKETSNRETLGDG